MQIPVEKSEVVELNVENKIQQQDIYEAIKKWNDFLENAQVEKDSPISIKKEKSESYLSVIENFEKL